MKFQAEREDGLTGGGPAADPTEPDFRPWLEATPVLTDGPGAEDLYRLLLSALAEAAHAVFLADAHGRIRWANQAFCRLSGYAPSELLGAGPRLLGAGRHDRRGPDDLWRTVLAGAPWSGEVADRRKDGSEYVATQTVTPVKDAQGRVTHVLAVLEEMTERKAAEGRLSHFARHDPLTGLPNRAVFRERLTEALAAARRTGAQVAVHFLDLDRFKQVNDQHGHAAGDELLCAVAGRLKACVRSTDTVVRLGGDEFAVIQTHLTREGGAAVLAGALVEEVAAPFAVGGREVRVSASVGVTVYPDDDCDGDADRLLRFADLAMYQAKQEGRNNFHFYTPALNARVQARLVLEAELRQALERDEFALEYQPKFDLATGRLAGAEALLRWHHPARGVMPPSEFLAVAEESGLIVPIGRWVLRRACTQMRAWREAGRPPVRLAVNISAVQLRRDDLVPLVTRVLAEGGLAPSLLELEVTEALLTDDPVASRAVLERLHALGVELAIDDFGVGYSSLADLRRYPVRRLKIDLSFVAGLGVEPADETVVRAVIGLGRSLGMRVLAEGVSAQRQLDFLRAAGCDEAQGYLLGPPVPAEQLERLLVEP